MKVIVKIEDAPELFTTAMLAELLGVGPTAVRLMRAQGRGPKPIVASNGHNVAYRREDVEAWFGQRDRLPRTSAARKPRRQKAWADMFEKAA